MNKRPFLLASAMTALLIAPVEAQISVGPAPKGRAANVAVAIIQENFGAEGCPSVTVAQRMPDGTIRAYCNNHEQYLVFSVEEIGKNVALKCSALKELGIGSC